MASDRRQWVLIPAAGESARFRAAGYSRPKPLLRIRHGEDEMSMIEHVCGRIPNTWRIVVGSRNGELFLNSRWSTVSIDRSRGQADTVSQMLKVVPPDEPVMVMDCDTLMQQEDLEAISDLSQQYVAVVAVGYDMDPAMSRVDQVPYPTLFVEKKLISPWGMVSVRAFRQAGALREALTSMLAEYESADKEPYLSEALNRIPGNKFALVCAKWTDWGTPEKVAQSGAEILEEVESDEAIRGHG